MGKLTGPRTPNGKKRSSQNAAKHWIQSGRILPSEQKDAGLLRHGFMEDFNPEGLAANEVVDDLVLNRLIRRRTDVAFTREFSKARALKPLIWLENQESTATQFWRRSALSRETYPGEYGARLRPDLCISGLEALRRRIDERGPQPDKDLPTLRGLYGAEPTEHAALLMYHLETIAEEHPTETTEQADLKKSILAAIQTEIQLQEQRLEVARDLDVIEFASEIQEPATPALETLLRYRAANTREFRDLLDSLERIRRLRRRPG
jgi:hypothetical protein